MQALGLALILITILITLQFGQMTQTLTIMLAIPFGFIGVAVSLWVFQSNLSVNSMLGLILLCGTAVNNSILFVDFFNRQRESGKDVDQALLDTAMLRFRPIMITTMTTILGMLPIALGFGSGGEILQPLGIAVCGGLGLSTVLTVVLVPLTLRLVAKAQAKFGLRDAASLAASATAVVMVLAIGFGWSTPSPAATMTLEQAEQQTLANHPELTSDRESAAAAYARYRSSFAPLLPRVSIARRYSEQDVKPTSGGAGFRLKSGVNTITVEETLANPWRETLDIRTQRARHDVSEAVYRNTKLTLQARVRKAYFAVQGAKQSLANAELNEKLAQETTEIARRRYRGGFIPKLDVARAEVRLRQVQASVVERRETLRAARLEFCQLLGQTGACNPELAEQLPVDFAYFKWPAPKLAELAGQGSSPRVEQLRSLQDAAAFQLKRGRADFLPDITVGASYVRRDPNSTSIDPEGPELYAQISWTLFEGGRSWYGMKESRANFESATADLVDGERDVQEQLLALANGLDSSRERFKAQLQDTEALKAIADDSRRRFNQGLVSSKQVNDDFEEYLSAQDRLISQTLAIIRSAADLAAGTSRPDLFKELL